MRRLLLVGLLLGAGVLPGLAQEPLKGKIVYSRKAGERYVLHVMNADGTGDMELPGQTAKLNFLPAVSRDGKRLAYMTGEGFDEAQGFQVVLAAPDGKGARTLNTGMDLTAIPAWSPDGKRLAFATGTQMVTTIHVADADGNGLRRVSEDGKRALFPFWLDAETVGYTAMTEEMRTELRAVKAAGGAGEGLVAGEGLILAGNGAVSPDGKRLAYVVLRPDMEGAVSIRIRDLAAKSEVTVSEGKVPVGADPEMLAAPAWAPDGKGLVVALGTEAGTALFYVTPEGAKRRLTPDGVSCATPAWYTPAP